jgi:hypothetical protein
MHAIGVDMSKASFHAALDDHVVKKFGNSESGIDAFLRCLRSPGIPPEDILIGIESTGVYHLLLCMRVSNDLTLAHSCHRGPSTPTLSSCPVRQLSIRYYRTIRVATLRA